MKTANMDIKTAARTAGVKLWQVAEKLGMGDGTLSRKLRHELPTEEKDRILSIIRELEGSSHE